MNKEKTPLISVLMSVYNGERWLADSIKSVLNQSFKDFEFIIVNDGSDDSSLKIIESFAYSDSRIRIFNKENSGLTHSLNYGLSKARGEWIARIDADDMCAPDRFLRQLQYSRSEEDLVLIGSGLFIIDDHGNQIKTVRYPKKHKRLIRSLSKGLPFFPHSSAFFKLENALEVGGYRAEFKRSQDQDLWLRLSSKGKITCLNKSLVSIRKHSEQISNENLGKKQHIYSYMAMTSYFLNLIGREDPFKSEEDDGRKFYKFVNENLIASNYFDYVDSISEIKLIFNINNSYLNQLRKLFKTLFMKPILIFKYIKFRLCGTNLPKRLAKAWIGFNNE